MNASEHTEKERLDGDTQRKKKEQEKGKGEGMGWTEGERSIWNGGGE